MKHYNVKIYIEVEDDEMDEATLESYLASHIEDGELEVVVHSIEAKEV